MNNQFLTTKVYDKIKRLNELPESLSNELSDHCFFQSAEKCLNLFNNYIENFSFAKTLDEKLEKFNILPSWGKYIYKEIYPRNIGCLNISGTLNQNDILISSYCSPFEFETSIQLYFKLDYVEENKQLELFRFSKDNNYFKGILFNNSGSLYYKSVYKIGTENFNFPEFELGEQEYDNLAIEVPMTDFIMLTVCSRFELYFQNSETAQTIKNKVMVNGANISIGHQGSIINQNDVGWDNLTLFRGVEASINFEASLKECRVWNKYLPSYEVKQYYNSNIYAINNLVCYYRFNDYVGTSIKDCASVFNGTIEIPEITSWKNNIFQGSRYLMVEKDNEIIPEGNEVYLDFEEPEPLSIEAYHENYNSAYQDLLEQANAFDKNNRWKITDLVPEHYHINNEDFSAFLNVIAIQFDNLKFLAKYLNELSNKWKLKISSSKIIGEEILEQYGFVNKTFFETLNLIDYYLFQNKKHNLYNIENVKEVLLRALFDSLSTIYKSKGTYSSIQKLLNTASIPSTNYQQFVLPAFIDNTTYQNRLLNKWYKITCTKVNTETNIAIVDTFPDTIILKCFLPNDSNEVEDFKIINIVGALGFIDVYLEKPTEFNYSRIKIISFSGSNSLTERGEVIINNCFKGTAGECYFIKLDVYPLQLTINISVYDFEHQELFNEELDILNPGAASNIIFNNAYLIYAAGISGSLNAVDTELFNNNPYALKKNYDENTSDYVFFKWLLYEDDDIKYIEVPCKFKIPTTSRSFDIEKKGTLIFDPLIYQSIVNASYTYDEIKSLFEEVWFYSLWRHLNIDKTARDEKFSLMQKEFQTFMISPSKLAENVLSVSTKQIKGDLFIEKIDVLNSPLSLQNFQKRFNQDNYFIEDIAGEIQITP